MKTHLEDSHNNKKIEIQEDKIEYSKLIESINFRILKHREFIKRDENVILRNIDFHQIVFEAIERINERKVKIGELQEFINQSLK